MPSSSTPRYSSSSSCASQFSNIGSRRPRDRLHRSSEVGGLSTGQTNNRPDHLVQSISKLFPFGKRRNNTNSNTNNPQAKLTPENLEAHDKRTSTTLKIIADEANIQKNSPKGFSPYYVGLLAKTSPESHQAKSSTLLGQVAESHGRPATSAGFTRTSNASSFFVKIYEGVLGSSCFQVRRKKDDKNHDQDQPPAPSILASAGLRNTVTKSTISVIDHSSVVFSPGRVEDRDGEKKLLRESNQSGAAADGYDDDINHDHNDNKAVPPLATDDHAPTATSSIDELKFPGQREFLWADKYRPKALEDFICNRNKAIQLQELVRIRTFPTTELISRSLIS